MSAPTIAVLGRRLHVFERVAPVGELFGLTRSTAYRTAERDSWPLSGGYVVVPALLDRLGLSYTVVEEASDDDE